MKKIRMEDLGIGRLEDWKTGRLWDDPSFPLSILPFKRLFWLLPPLLLIILFMLANWCFPLPKARLHPPSSPIVLDKNGQWLRAFLAEDGMWRIAVSHQFPSAVSEIAINRSSEGFRESRVSESHSVLLHQAILTSEDRWFY
ncbi:MAG: hypothetical protein OXU27_09545, partial [Candidatus Poribacteria bacterium]|nr:hypothetical protein [Candidatus Poribacteria bacterium]